MVAVRRWTDVMAMVLSCARKRIEHERNCTSAAVLKDVLRLKTYLVAVQFTSP